MHSGKGGRSPSSDGLRKPPRASSLREASGKSPGGQPGHSGKTPSWVAEPDETVDHFPVSCSGCGAALDAASATGHVARQVFDLPDPQPSVVIEELMADLFGVHLVTAMIASVSRHCAARLAGVAAALCDHVAAVPVKHLDETGLRIGGKTQRLHIASTLWLTFYRISPRRGSLPEHMSGIVVHDR